MPVVTIIAGPNGAGKTTFAKRLVEQTQWRGVTFLNVDEIAKTLSSSGARAPIDVLAGRVFLEALKRKIDERSDVILETTLARLGLAQDIPRWRATGYRVDLYYLRLPDADTAVARVATRVSNRGHGIPEETIRRRFTKSLEYLETRYIRIVDEWFLIDSGEGRFELVLAGENHEP